MSLGAELRSARRAAGMTQEQLASTARVDRGYISEIENDHQSPTVDMLRRLCDALGVRASTILARAEDAWALASDDGPG